MEGGGRSKITMRRVLSFYRSALYQVHRAKVPLAEMSPQPHGYSSLPSPIMFPDLLPSPSTPPLYFSCSFLHRVAVLVQEKDNTC